MIKGGICNKSKVDNHKIIGMKTRNSNINLKLDSKCRGNCHLNRKWEGEECNNSMRMKLISSLLQLRKKDITLIK
jgi:hypothetical protein